MKMTTVLSIAAILTITAASTVFGAAKQFTDAGTDTCGTPSIGVKPSKNTRVLYLASATTSGTGVISYSVSAYHTSGTKTFGSSSGDTKIFMIDGIGSEPAAAPAAGASAAYGSWTAM